MHTNHCCTNIDDFISEKTIWEAHLNNNLIVYQDDDRPNQLIPSAWERLKQLLQQDINIFIKELRLRFRDHIEVIPFQNSPIYFFSRGLGMIAGNNKPLHYYILGGVTTNLNQLHCCQYKIPELILMQTFIRPINKALPQQLIYNNINQDAISKPNTSISI